MKYRLSEHQIANLRCAKSELRAARLKVAQLIGHLSHEHHKAPKAERELIDRILKFLSDIDLDRHIDRIGIMLDTDHDLEIDRTEP